MTPAERARLMPHAAGLITAAHTDNPDDAAHQLAEIAYQLGDASTWALIVTLAHAIDPDISLDRLRIDDTTLDQLEQAWTTRAETVHSTLRRTNRDVPQLVRDGIREKRRNSTRKDTAA